MPNRDQQPQDNIKPADQALADVRREYLRGGLKLEDLNPEPIAQLELWLQQAQTAQVNDPTAMALASVDERGMPYQRIVLVKGIEAEGLLFYTNYTSRKAQQLASNPQASALFFWSELERQIKINGRIEKLSEAQSKGYFESRPRESQIAAWSSFQSTPIANRDELEARFQKLTQRFEGQGVPYPEFWGGYRLVPDKIEFWQGGAHRLHDRFIYRRQQESWTIQCLAP